MHKTVLQQPVDQSTRGRRLKTRSGGPSRSTFWVLTLLFATTVCCRAIAEETTTTPRPGESPPSKPPSSVRTVQMTEKEFEAFMQRRTELQRTYGLEMTTRISAFEDEIRKERAIPFLIVHLPDRRVAFASRHVIIRLYRADATRLVEALPYFPETNLVSVWHDEETSEVYWRPRPYETTPIPGWLLEGLRKLAQLDALYFQGGTFDREAMATIAAYPSLRRLSLGRCRVTKESLSELTKLKTLESFSVIAGLGPECFITLAKLPRFREFYLLGGSTDDFNVPVDEETRRAIESLNGRLEKFSTSYEETPDVTVHASIVRALLKVKSLRVLRVELVGKGLTLSDVRQLEDLSELTCLKMHLDWSRAATEEYLKARAIVSKVRRRAEERRENEQREKAGSKP